MPSAKPFHVGATCLAVLLIGACGEGGTPTVTATASSPATPTPSPSTPPTTARPTGAPAARIGVVPDVVGVNHQLAQDTMQAAGFYFLTEQDATGQGRLLIVDRNWVVVSQEPKGGTRAPADTKIILRAKKIGE